MNNSGAFTSILSQFLQIMQEKKGTCYDVQMAAGVRVALAAPRQTKCF